MSGINRELSEAVRKAVALQKKLRGTPLGASAYKSGEEELRKLLGPDSINENGCLNQSVGEYFWTSKDKSLKVIGNNRIEIRKTSRYPLFFFGLSCSSFSEGGANPASLHSSLPHISAPAALAAGIYNFRRWINETLYPDAARKATDREKKLRVSLEMWLHEITSNGKEWWVCPHSNVIRKEFYYDFYKEIYILNDSDATCLTCKSPCEGPYCLSIDGEQVIESPFGGAEGADKEDEPADAIVGAAIGRPSPSADAPQKTADAGGAPLRNELEESGQLRLGEDFPRPEDVENAPTLQAVRAEMKSLAEEKKRLDVRRKIYARQMEYLSVVAAIEKAKAMSVLEKQTLCVALDLGLSLGVAAHPFDSERNLGWISEDRLEDSLVYAAFRGGEAVTAAAAKAEMWEIWRTARAARPEAEADEALDDEGED
jgi:hypothetical protein